MMNTGARTIGNDQPGWTRPLLHALGRQREAAGKNHPAFLFLATEQGCPADERIVRDCLKAADIPFSAPLDWCGVRNFQEETRPRIIALPAGKGVVFRRDMEHFVDEVNRRVRDVLLSECVQKEIREVRRRSGRHERSLARGFYRSAQGDDITDLRYSRGHELPAEPHDHGSLPASPAGTGGSRRIGGCLPDLGEDDHLYEDFETARERIRETKRQCSEEIRRRTERAAQRAIAPLTARLRRRYHSFPKVLVYLEDVERDILNNLTAFTLPARTAGPAVQGKKPGLSWRDQLHAPYTVAVLVGRSGGKEYPVIFARSPNREALMGCFSPEGDQGCRDADAAGMRGGLIHKANGGCLVVEASWIIRNIHLWELIKKAAMEREHILTAPAPHAGIFTSGNRVSESMPLQVAVVVAGTRTEHSILSIADQNFAGLVGNPWHPKDGSGETPVQTTPDTAFIEGDSLSCHPSARKAIIRLCTQPGIPNERFAEHLESLLCVFGRARAYAGIQEITAEHVTLALQDACPRSLATPESGASRRHPSPAKRIRYTVEPVTMMEPTKSHS